MKHLKKLLKTQLRPVPVSLAVSVLVIAVLGFADASYLALEHYRGVIPPCSIVSGCETVLTSPYSLIAGIPVSLLGAIYYLIIAIGVFAYLDTRRSAVLKWTLSLTVFGLIMSLWFIYAQAFIIGAWCLYCLGSAASSITLFILATVVFRKYTDKFQEPGV